MNPLPSDGYICYLVTEHLKKLVSEASTTKLSLFNFFVLQYVERCSEQCECTQYQISQALLADTSKVNKAVRELESSGLINAVKTKENGRVKKMLSVTEQGRSLIRLHRTKTDDIATRYVAEVRDKVSVDELFDAHAKTMAAFYDALKLYKSDK
ncbi:hypothetical protein [Vibrio maritimus]|uniref:hypothetical protein n=1 Tax=Vibrio maritimus TaxID=990268 RepID=UPI003736DEAA